MENVVIISGDPELEEKMAREWEVEGCRLSAQEEGILGEDALPMASPDLILLDMRQKRGKELLAWLGKSASWGDVPIIALGEFNLPEEWAPILECGACDYLAFPLNQVELAAKAKVRLREKKRLDQFKAEAVVDELTGVYNRRYMESQLVSKLGEAQRYHHPFSYMILDIDHFKRVNDDMGHPFGDLVLHEVATLMKGLIRKEDVLTRYGGEEFALLLPHTDRIGASVLGERVRSAVAEKSFGEGEKQRQVTISIGVATYPLDSVIKGADLVGCADGRLYRAKEEGRNRVVCE
jgi:two-component system, cell cycle response regulator